MNKFAVAFISFFDNDLTIKVVEAKGWYEALMQHPRLKDFQLPNSSLKDAKQEAFNTDAMIDVIEL